ncbi:NACHT, LRR and PYD domains-containing protein 1 homolog isoform X2 [Perca fluviatilis]|uniref:NACHT, LRR and PYD domains-containing protein 1 homolog isoform X2 n=1 Tax=Perca fluviatilis TaxID=8168 RepID=UPI001965528C|nr:NACHT, LRR and PYD domains-containing protein 1 homolog isoform X2 [Perca fluviatilis]
MADEKHFVDKHRIKLIEKVSNIPAILDELLRENVIQEDSYDKIRALPTSQDKMRELVSGPLEAIGVQGKEIFYKILNKHESYLINDLKTTEVPVEPKTAKKMLFETLNDLSSEELHTFKSLFELEKGLPLSPRSLQDTVELMVETYSHECVELTKKVLKKMNRTDLLQRLSDISSGTKEKQQPSLIQRVETMTSVIELLLETLKELRDGELQKFKKVLDFHRNFSDAPSSLQGSTDRQDIVFSVVKTYGQQSVEKTKEVLMEMERTDLVQKLSDSSSAPKKKHSVDEYLSALIHNVATMRAVKELLLETLSGLSSEELEKFKWLLQFRFFQRGVLKYSSRQLQWTDGADELVDGMLENYDQQSVEVTREVLMEMKRTDLVQMLSETSSGTKAAGTSAQASGVTTIEKEKLSALIPKVAKAAVVFRVLETLKAIKTKSLLDMKRTDLVQRLSETKEEVGRKRSIESQVAVMEEPGLPSSVISSGLKKTHQSKPLRKGATGEALNWDPLGRDSTPGIDDCPLHDWTKLEPEVNSPDADEVPTYSLQSEAGNFECSVSGLRWVCKEKVSFKYQFCSWEGIMERMESLQYMPAGPLMDITVIAGKLDEVYLPHWICLDDNPKILDRFAVLHIDDCGDVVEKVSEVTSSHVKLSEPVFSPRAALMKMGLPVKIGCQVLIYYIPNTSFLRLHVYLIPHDHGLQQTVDKNKEKKGYKRIEKPRPDKYLKMQQGFKLAADTNMAKILPEEITLRYDSQDPNFYEVFIENPDTNFQLTLSPLNKKKKKKGEPQCEPVWICEIQKVDYQDSADSEETCGQSPVHGLSDKKPSLDGRLAALMEKAATVTTDRERILIMLQDLNQQEFKQFIWQLEYSDIGEGRERIPSSKLENSDMFDLVNQMWKTYIQQSVEVTMKVLKQIDRNDLVQILSVTSS